MKGRINMLKQIQLKSKEDVDKIVKFATLYPYCTRVTCGNVTIDAMSVLGLMSLVGKENVKLLFSDHDGEQRNEELLKCLHKAKLD